MFPNMIPMFSNPFTIKEGAQGEGEAEVRDQRKGYQKGTPTSDVDFHISLLRSWVWDERDRRKYERRCGVSLHKKSRGNWGLVLSFHDMNGE